MTSKIAVHATNRMQYPAQLLALAKQNFFWGSVFALDERYKKNTNTKHDEAAKHGTRRQIMDRKN